MNMPAAPTMNKTTLWACPRCGHTETQAAAVRQVGHHCYRPDGRYTHLQPLPPDTPQPELVPAGTTPTQATLWDTP